MGTQQAPVAVGDVLAGKYRVERVLGAGGMGVVVAAEHLQLRQLVAIKFVLPDALGNAEAVERFLREARAVVRLKSEHIARVIDVATLPNGAPYMVMEFLDGYDLQTILEHNGSLSVEFVAHCLIQACEALAEAHSLGIVHRDLKPQNLFLTRSIGATSLLKVLDFGVSKMESPHGTRGLTRTSMIMGSPYYMAPEQMRSARDATLQSDIWALGVVAYHLLTSHLPFEAESIPELCLKVALESPLPLRSRRSDIPERFEAVIMRCLERDPPKRFANVAELASALEPFAPPVAHADVERAQLIVRGMRPSEISATLKADDAQQAQALRTPAHQLREPTPVPWSSTHGETKNKRRPRRIAIAVASLACAIGVALFLFFRAERDEREVVSRPATLQSATVRFNASSAPSKELAQPPLSVYPAPAPAPAVADAGRAPSLRPPSAPRPDDDIPTLR